MSVQHVRKWCREIDNGRANIHDDDGTCWPSTSSADVNAVRVEELIFKNRPVTIRDSSATLHLFIGTVHNTVHEPGHHKACARCVPRCLTEEIKNRRFYITLSHHRRFKEEGNEFLEPTVSANETCAHHFTSQSKNKLDCSGHTQLFRESKKLEVCQTAEEIMASVFWDAKAVIHVEDTPRDKTVGANVHCDTLRRLREAVRRKISGRLWRGAILRATVQPRTADVRHKSCCCRRLAGNFWTVHSIAQTLLRQTSICSCLRRNTWGVANFTRTKKWKLLFLSGCECKKTISTAIEFLNSCLHGINA